MYELPIVSGLVEEFESAGVAFVVDGVGRFYIVVVLFWDIVLWWNIVLIVHHVGRVLIPVVVLISFW